jgi:alpha-L-arabinofuranosidase
VQSLFSRNRGDQILPVALSQLSPAEGKRFYASSSFDAASGEVILKLVNATPAAVTTSVDLAGANHVSAGKRTVLQSDQGDALNTFEQVDHVVPQETAFSPTGSKFDLTLPANSFTVVRVGVAR